MVFIDYITLMLLNMVAGLVLLATWVAWGCMRDDQRAWAPGFGLAGLVGLATGLHMSFTWPLPGPYNSAFGETTVLLSGVLLAGAVALAARWGLLGVLIYAAIAGLAGIVVGVRIWDLGLTARPPIAAAGFILTGLAGPLTAVAVALRRQSWLRALAALVLLLAAAIWLLTATLGFWGHMESFRGYQPPTLQTPTQPVLP